MDKVKVCTKKGVVHEYEGCKAGLGPECCIIVTEEAPDVTGKSDTGKVENMVFLYAPGTWEWVDYE